MNNGLVHLGISGGGFKISGLAGGVIELLDSGISPDVISGISSGSILTFVLCGSSSPRSVIEDNAIGFNSSDVFSRSPFNKRGGLRVSSIINGIFKNYFTKQDRLYTLLSGYVSETEWEYYRDSKYSPDGIIMSVDLIRGSREIVNLKDYNYKDAIGLVIASCSIPVYVNPIYFKEMVLVDGGIRNHILTEWILDAYNIKESYSIFSRSSDFKKYTTKEKLKTLPQVLIRTIEIMENEISKGDELLADLKAAKKGIYNKNFYIYDILDNVYDDDIEKQRFLYELGKNTVRKNL